MRRAPRRRRGDLDRAVLMVRDSAPRYGDRAEDGLEREWACPPPLDALTPFAAPEIQDQLAVRLLDQRAEELSLDLQPGGMDGGLEEVGQVLILVGHQQGDGHRQGGGEILASPLDRTKVDGSLKAVGIAHGESPYWSYGVHRVCFSRTARQSHPPGAILPCETVFLSPVSHLMPRTNWRAPTNCLLIDVGSLRRGARDVHFGLGQSDT